ncbi:MAG: SDR family NAD(P)-dependent oxidoreductase [Bacteroidetes bacterium]|nr:SDR family NAD(P)-dependent oxidoreductase [Bacteroidota bacterium]
MQKISLKNKTAVVTGASKGIGRAVAIALAKEGVNVVLAARNAELLRSVEHEITAAGGNAFSVPTDITSEQSVEQLIRETQKQFSSVDILVNNAGVGIFSNVVDMSVAQYDEMMNVNLKGVFLTCRAVIPLMMKQQHGEVINIASLAGKNSFPGGSVYAASKWGLIGFARSLMPEVREYNIRIVTISPGSVNTTFAENEKENPNIVQPEDVAETVLFALTMPGRSNVSEIDIRPTLKPKK